MSGQWIVPFKGRNPTSVFGLNFLWRSGNVFVMDNHRAAAWCWSQCVKPWDDHALVHIDRHRDTLGSDLKTWISLLPKGIPHSIHDYLTLEQQLPSGGKVPVFRWDNYLSIYFALHGPAVKQSVFATHREGDWPNHRPTMELEADDLLTWLAGPLPAMGIPAIMNLDLDYFFADGLTYDDDGTIAIRIFDNEYVDDLCERIVALDKAGQLPVITIALTATPGLTGGWAPAEALATRICAALGHSFELP